MSASRQKLSFSSLLLTGLFILCFIPWTQGQEAVKREVQFNGYTNHWQDHYNELYRYGNLFKVAATQVEKTFMQSKVNTAADLGIPGLLMEEGFMNGLLSAKFVTLELPELDALKDALSQGDVLAYLDPGTESGEKVAAYLPEDWEWPLVLGSYQYGTPDLKRVDLFTIEKDGHTLYAVSSADADTRQSVKALIESALALVDKYDFHKGWFGAKTLHNSVTCTKGHPLEVIGTGLE